MAKELQSISYISIGGAPPVRFDSLSAEKRAECVATMAENIGKTLSNYLSNNPKEAETLLKASEKNHQCAVNCTERRIPKNEMQNRECRIRE